MKRTSLLVLWLLTACAIPGFAKADHYKYSIWDPSVVYASNGSSSTLYVYTEPGVTDVQLNQAGILYKLYDDGTHGDKKSGDNIFTCQNIEYAFPTRTEIGISTFGAELELLLQNGQSEKTTPATLGIIENKPEYKYEATEFKKNVWVTDYGVFIKDYGVIFPGIPVTKITCGKESYEAFRYLYEVFPDEFDFVTIMPAKTQINPDNYWEQIPYSVRAKNEVQNIGIDIFNDTNRFFSAGKLRLMIYHSFGIPQVLDHEVGHAWGADLGRALHLCNDSHHWAEWSNLYGQINSFPIIDIMKDNGDGTVKVEKYDSRPLDNKPYTDLLLYCMGLVGKDEIKKVRILNDYDPADWNRVPKTSFTSYKGEKILQREGGIRIPEYPDTQKEFTMAFVFVSDKDFTPVEINFFSRIAEWFGSEEPDYYNGMNFHRATRGKGKMITKLPMEKIKKPLSRELPPSRVKPSKRPDVLVQNTRTGTVDLYYTGHKKLIKGSTKARQEKKKVGSRTVTRTYYMPGSKVHCTLTVMNRGTVKAEACQITPRKFPKKWTLESEPFSIASGEKKTVDFYILVPSSAKKATYKREVEIVHPKDTNSEDNRFFVKIKVVK